MADEWYYTKNNERQGPVTPAKLKEMVTQGWLAPTDLVWKAGMTKWLPASKVRGLFGGPLAQKLAGPITGIPPRADHKPGANAVKKQPHPDGGLALDKLSFRHVIAACGGFIAALGIAFTAIEQSPVALAFTLGGLVLAAAGLYVEVGRLIGQAIENIGKASREAAERRQEAKRLAIEKQRLDLEAQKLAHEQALAQQSAAGNAFLPVPAGAAGGQVVVINQPPVQRWSPGLAAVLSFFLPGLGQLYKGQILNGIVWFIVVGIGYLALILPGLVLHLFCILGALSGNPWTEGKTTVVRQ